MNAPVYNQRGESAGTVELSTGVFALPWNANLVHQVATSMQANRRANGAHTKNRGEVQGTGRKPWRQKGTGRARHGSRRSPIWRHGGVAHGPRPEKNYRKTIPSGMRRKALYTVLSQKFRDGEVVLVDKLTFAKPKTKEAAITLHALAKAAGHADLATRARNAALVATYRRDEGALKSFNNIPGARVMEARNLNPLDLLTYKYLVLENPQESQKRWE